MRQNKSIYERKSDEVSADQRPYYAQIKQDREQREKEKQHHFNRLRGLYMQSPPKKENYALRQELVYGDTALKSMLPFLGN